MGISQRAKNIFSKSKAYIQNLYRINDSPQRIALGFGLGVFLGVMPGLGIVVSLVLATFLRLNRASALVGTALTNTWLSFAIFILSIKTGSAIIGTSWNEIYAKWNLLIKEFSWQKVFAFSFWEIIRPILLGYVVVSVLLGVVAYLLALLLILGVRYAKNKS